MSACSRQAGTRLHQSRKFRSEGGIGNADCDHWTDAGHYTGKIRDEEEPTSQNGSAKEMTTWSGLYRFSRAEIENAINYRNEKKCLGRGSAGRVYKGVLPSGQAVAVKHIYKSNTSDSFRREVEGLSRVRHPNLVCLFGYCIEDGEQYLVYEYCPAGNLAYHLRSTSGSTSFLPLISFLFFIRKKGE
ncbi:probable serine/threonine-protein kinase PBL28, partial [Eucalyptus grandis]|uniref:probable serine/threonine-protein kinase PBL28 n=1 Tax=Eucalyptus grandis TaxID=71139 RepID=UPI00192EBE19